MARDKIDFRYVTRADCLTMLRAMIHQLVVVDRVLKDRLGRQHREFSYAGKARHHLYPAPFLPQDDQHDLAITRRKLHLLNVMIAAGRNKLHPYFIQRRNMPSDVIMSEQEHQQLMGWQGNWVEAHKVWDYDRVHALNTAQSMPMFRGWGGQWWYDLQLALGSTMPADFHYARGGHLPMFFTEAWDALVGLPDVHAREAAVRLAGRRMDGLGLPVIHPWPV